MKLAKEIEYIKKENTYFFGFKEGLLVCFFMVVVLNLHDFFTIYFSQIRPQHSPPFRPREKFNLTINLCLYVYLSIYLVSVYVSIYMSLPIYPSLYNLSIYLCVTSTSIILKTIYLSIFLFIYLSGLIIKDKEL